MQVRALLQPVRIFSSKEYGQRLLFVNGLTNPRNELGKMGVKFHERHVVRKATTVTARFQLLDDANHLTDRTFTLNRASLCSYLSAHVPGQKVDDNLTDDGLLDLLEHTLEAHQAAKALPPVHDEAEHFAEAPNVLTHGGRHNTRPLVNQGATCLDDTRARFLGWLYQSTILSVSRLHKRFIFARTESAYFRTGEMLAKYRFKEALEGVPAYTNFVADNAPAGFPSTPGARFVDVPITAKANYIKPHESSEWFLHFNGELPEQNKVDTSTGTTGKPSSWTRGLEELKTVKRSLRVASEIEYGSERNLEFINAFALGPWATGMTAYELMRNTGSVFASGPDMEKILDQLEKRYQYEQYRVLKVINEFIETDHDTLEALRPVLIELTTELVTRKLDDKDYNLAAGLAGKFEQHPELRAYRRGLLKMLNAANAAKSQNIIAGYPPFLDKLADHANASGIDFKKYRARGVVGGQAISEALRDKLIAAGFSHINSSYGASDLDINIGVETEFEIRFRKTLEANPALAEELYGKNMGVPMVFHFDPFNYFIESDENDDLIFTCTRNDRSSPRVRYNLGDKGRVYAASDLEAILVKHGILDLKPRINFPLVFVWGRDSAVNYRGAKVSFTDLERAITTLDAENVCAKRAFFSSLDEQGREQFEIWMELKEGVEIPTPDKNQRFLALILQKMAQLNQDFKYHLDIKDEVALPKLKVFAHGMSPISDPGGHRKQVLVFKNTNLPNGYQFPIRPDQMLEVEIHKGYLHSVVPGVGYGNGSPRLMRQDSKGKVEIERVVVNKI